MQVFCGLAIICDEFFVPALEMITDALKLSPDVAGATFLAAGSSAPELFTSVADTFAAKEGEGGAGFGLGTIVGSAMFNILVIVALSAAVVPGAVKVDPRPIIRDCSFYGASLVALMVTMRDGKIEKDEAGAMVGMYALYILFMVFNESIFNVCPGLSHGHKSSQTNPYFEGPDGASSGTEKDAEVGGDDEDEDGGDPDKYWDKFEFDSEGSTWFDKVCWELITPTPTPSRPPRRPQPPSSPQPSPPPPQPHHPFYHSHHPHHRFTGSLLFRSSWPCK